MERKRVVEMSKGYGKPKVGGPFYLRDLEGNEFTEKNLLGKYTLVCSNVCLTIPVTDDPRSILASPTAPISAPTSSTRCPQP